MPTTAIDTNNNLTTLVQVKLYCQSTADTSFDTRLNGLIDAVSHEFNARTGRLLKRRTTTEYYDGSGTPDLYLRRYPIRSLSSGIDVRSVSVRADFTTETTEFSTAAKVASSYLAIYSSEGRIRRIDGSFPLGHQNIKVAYDAGYTVSTAGLSSSAYALPADLRNAVHESIAFQFERNKANRHGVQNMTQEMGSKTYSLDEPATIEPVIARYRRVDGG